MNYWRIGDVRQVPASPCAVTRSIDSENPGIEQHETAVSGDPRQLILAQAPQ